MSLQFAVSFEIKRQRLMKFGQSPKSDGEK